MENLENNSVLKEYTIDEDDVGEPPRRSLSQPVLQTTSNAVPKQIPILKTYEENDKLKMDLYSARSEIQMYKYRYRELKETLPKPTQDIIDEYITLKHNKMEADASIKGYLEIQQELIVVREKLADAEEDKRRQDQEFEKAKEEMDRRIQELQSIIANHQNRTFDQNQSSQTITNTTNDLLTLDDILKKDDPNFTITTDEDRQIQKLTYALDDEKEKVFELEERIKFLTSELEEKSARLADSDTQKAQLMAAAGMGVLGSSGANDSKTFMIGNARESVSNDHLVYIDDLEKQLKTKQEYLDNATAALTDYMNQVTELERELKRLRSNTFDTSSYLVSGKNAEELREQIARVNVELNTLRSENRHLRIRCDQLNGGDGNVSNSFGQSRLSAGVLENDNDLSKAHATGRITAMSSLNGENTGRQSERSEYSDNDSVMLNSSAERKMNEEDDANYLAVLAEYESFRLKENDTAENSLNASMPPPDKLQTESFLKIKSVGNSPAVSVAAEKHGIHSLNNSFSSRTSSAVTTIPAHESSRLMRSTIVDHDGPLMQEVQQILNCSAALIESGQQASADVEKMHGKMKVIREVLSRLFERLKSSAALFEEILESMGSSSPLADRIKNMKLAFETSVCDHGEVSGFLEAAERDLINMSINFSMLEKSIVDPSFIADVSRRFTIAPDGEENMSSSLLNPSYTPIFRFGNAETELSKKQHQEIEELKMQIVKLHEELDKAKNASLRLECTSPGLNTSVLQRHVSELQMKASQNFEELEVAQGQLVRVEHEKEKIQEELQEMSLAYRDAKAHIAELTENVKFERSKYLSFEAECQQKVEQLTKSLKSLMDNEEKLNSDNRFLEEKVNELEDRIGGMKVAEKKNLREIQETEAENRDLTERLGSMRLRAKDAEMTVNARDQEIVHLNKVLNEVSMERDQLKELESELSRKSRSDVKISGNGPVYAFARSSQTDQVVEIGGNEDEKIKRLEKEAVEGIEKVQKELAALLDKQLKCKPIMGNISSIGVSCNEMCQRLIKEKKRQHEQAEALRKVNDFYEAQNATSQSHQKIVDQENVAPVTSVSKTSAATTSSTSQHADVVSTKKYRDPTRQLLHDSTFAVDALVQKLKKTQYIEGMNAKLKDTIGEILKDMRELRDFLHQKFVLFKSIDLEQYRNETNEQLWQRLSKALQDFAMVDEECKKMRSEIKKLRGLNYEEKIQKELAGIASDQMRTMTVLKKK